MKPPSYYSLTTESPRTEAPLVRIVTGSSWFQPSESYALSKLENEISKLSIEKQSQYYELHEYKREGETNEKTLNIFRTNAYPAGLNAAGVFPQISRLNSACNPNVHYNYDTKRNVSTVYAIRPIIAQTEILNCYIGLFMPRKARLEYLMRNFGFHCDCSTCRLQGVELQHSDFRRKKLVLT